MLLLVFSSRANSSHTAFSVTAKKPLMCVLTSDHAYSRRNVGTNGFGFVRSLSHVITIALH